MFRKAYFILSAVVMLTLFPLLSRAQQEAMHVHEGMNRDLQVELWVNRGEASVYNPGDQVRVYFRPTQSCYVIVYSIDTEGYIRVLYPYGYDDEPFVHSGETVRVPDAWDHRDLQVSGPSGIEYVAAVASFHPIYIPQWPRYYEAYYEPSYGLIDHICGDPYEGMHGLNDYIIPVPYREYGWATASTYFYVEQRVWYPRYMCYDCHWPRPTYFHPYMDVCLGFEIVIVDHDWYDDWAYWRPHHTSARYRQGCWNVRRRQGPASGSYSDERYSRRRGFGNIGFSKTDVEPVDRQQARDKAQRVQGIDSRIPGETGRGAGQPYDKNDTYRKDTPKDMAPAPDRRGTGTAPAPRQDTVTPQERSRDQQIKTEQKKTEVKKAEPRKTDSAPKQQRQFWQKITDQKKTDSPPQVTKTPSNSSPQKFKEISKTAAPEKKGSETKKTTSDKNTSDKRSKRR